MSVQATRPASVPAGPMRAFWSIPCTGCRGQIDTVEDLSALEPLKAGEHQSLGDILSVLGLSRITEVTEWGTLRSRILDSGGFVLHVGGASSAWDWLRETGRIL